MLVVSIILFAIAAIFGIINLLKIQKESKPYKAALIHGVLNTLWLMFFTVLAGIQFKTYADISIPSLAEALSSVVVFLGMLYSNFPSGELLLKFQIAKKDFD